MVAWLRRVEEKVTDSGGEGDTDDWTWCEMTRDQHDGGGYDNVKVICLWPPPPGLRHLAIHKVKG